MDFIPESLNLFSNNNHSSIFIRTYEEELTSSVPVDLKTTLDFTSPAYSNRMKSLSGIYFYAKLQIVKQDGSKYLESDKNQPRLLNNICGSLFKSCKLYLNNTLVNSIENYHFKSYVECLLNYSNQNVKGKFNKF